jgi:uncharacterized iron-regulated membrane protein
MANSIIRSGKPLLKTIHTWIGICTGLFLSVIAVTGSVILFRAEFERASLPAGEAGDLSHRVSLSQVVQEVAKVRPDSRIRRVRIPVGREDTYVIQVQSAGKRTERVVADAFSAKILGTLQTGWVEWMIDLHRNLLSGNAGRGIVGGFGIVLFVLSATGLLMWLTGARNWRAWISVRRKGSATRFNYELHRASGLWAYAFLAVISFTGIELAYPNSFRDAVQSLTGKPATVRAPRNIPASGRLPLDDYLRVGQAAMPDGVPVELRLPEKEKGPVDLRLYRAGDLSPSGNHVYLDPSSGAVLAIDRIVDRPLGARFLAAMSPVHYAQFGGMTLKIAWALFGLTPLLLFVTGLIAWWRPAKSKSGRPAPAEADSENLALTGR